MMYSSYSALQRRQLTKQVYTDTQSSYLLVYAPGRHLALENSLANQLHRKFRLVTELAPALTDSVEGVLLVSEDLECTSTALTYFAAALRTGADFVVCDAAFGFDGSTALYLSTQHIPCSRCAMVSRKLLDRVRAAARGRDSVTELLRLATAMAENCHRIPQSLLHFRRELCADDVFSADGKRALILSHELTMTGAPIVLTSAVPVLRSMGFEVVVLGPADDGSLPLFLDAGAAVVTRPDCVTSSALWGLATSADLVLANTVVEAPVVNTLNGSFVPVLWWLHDAFAGYPFISHSIPKALGKNVHLCAVGSHATAAMHSVRPDFAIEQLIYGLPDYAAEQFPRYDISFAGGRPLFVTVGSLEHRKGPDIFCNAIRLLPSAVREKAAFLFVGKAADKGMYNAVDSLVRDYPQTVFYRKRLERPEVKSLMEQCNCVVCASRDDPMPTFVTEGLIFGKPSIVSEHTGTAGLVTEGVDGFLYKDDDPQQLAVLLEHAIEHPEELGTESLYELRQLLVQYPFFQTARILYLKNLYLLRDPSFKDELRKGALFVADLSILFYAIEGDKFVINRHVVEKENVSSETSDRTLDLIDRFLADDKDLSVEKLFPLPVEAVDYTSVLMEKEGNTETASVNPLRGQDLIDHFIEQAAREEAKGVEPIKETALLEEESSSETVKMEEVVPDTEKEESDTEEGEDYFTETLAKIYVKQQRYDKALEIIKKLNLKYPKKNTYFADQIRFLEKLIINAKSK